jgi:hypothetical protein
MDAKRVGKMVGGIVATNLFLIFVTVVLIVMIILWVYSKTKLNSRNCSVMDSLYKDFPKIHNINPSNENYKNNLRDYYIKTAYNACSAGGFKNDFVNTCALTNCIKQGARCLDFQIYSLENSPVIATSSVSDFTVKETYNSVPFSEAVQIINDYAFSGSTSPNPNDPLIIHLRMMSNNKEIYGMMAKDITTILGRRILGPKYSYENHGNNLGSLPLSEFLGKIIIIVDKTNPLFEDTPLDEYVNLASNSIFMRCLRYSSGIKYTPDIDELTEYNKKNMTICLPDISPSSENYSASLAFKCGCQMVGMSFQNFDNNMEYYDEFFDSAGSAFVLKPEPLRFVPITIDPPTPPPERYSYKQRDISSDFYKFTI